jgi:hypothetical protein
VTNFRVGDPDVKVDEGYARLSGQKRVRGDVPLC